MTKRTVGTLVTHIRVAPKVDTQSSSYHRAVQQKIDTLVHEAAFFAVRRNEGSQERVDALAAARTAHDEESLAIVRGGGSKRRAADLARTVGELEADLATLEAAGRAAGRERTANKAAEHARVRREALDTATQALKEVERLAALFQQGAAQLAGLRRAIGAHEATIAHTVILAVAADERETFTVQLGHGKLFSNMEIEALLSRVPLGALADDVSSAVSARVAQTQRMIERALADDESEEGA